MGVPNLSFFTFLRDTFLIENFVESGSGRGETVGKVINVFPQVFTVELHPDLFQLVKKQFGSVCYCHHGRSYEVFQSILPAVQGAALFWLDAHWSPNEETGGKEEQCPVLKELQEINKRPLNMDFIFIDDAHLFFSPAAIKPPLDYHQWPNIMEIFHFLGEKDRYTFILSSFRCIRHNEPHGIVFPENVIVSVPMYTHPYVFQWLSSFHLEGV